MLVLHDWSHFIALQPEEIDSERGVIMEELRTRDGASWRSTMKLLQALGKGTRYEHRNLIGYLDGLKSFEHDALSASTTNGTVRTTRRSSSSVIWMPRPPKPV